MSVAILAQVLLYALGPQQPVTGGQGGSCPALLRTAGFRVSSWGRGLLRGPSPWRRLSVLLSGANALVNAAVLPQSTRWG